MTSLAARKENAVKELLSDKDALVTFIMELSCVERTDKVDRILDCLYRQIKNFHLGYTQAPNFEPTPPDHNLVEMCDKDIMFFLLISPRTKGQPNLRRALYRRVQNFHRKTGFNFIFPEYENG